MQRKVLQKKIESIFCTATGNGHKKYIPDVIKFAINNEQHCNFRDFDNFLWLSVNHEQRKFSPEHFNMLINLNKKYGFNDEDWNEALNLKYFISSQHTKETEKQIIALHDLGFNNKQTASTLKLCYYDIETLKSLTENIPDLNYRYQIEDFLEQRTNLAQKSKNSKTVFDKTIYNYYNEICNKILQKEKNLPYIEIKRNINIEKGILDNAKKHLKDFTIKALDYMPMKEINDILTETYTSDYEQVLELFEALDDDIKPQFKHLVKDLIPCNNKSKKVMRKYLETVYPQYKDKTSAHHFLELLDLCFVYGKNNEEIIDTTRLNYVLNNLNKSEEQLRLELNFVKEDHTDIEKIKIVEKLLSNGFTPTDINMDMFMNYGIWENLSKSEVNEKLQIWADNLIELKNTGVSDNYISEIAKGDFSGDKITKLLEIRNEALNRRDTLQVFGNPLQKKRSR